MKGAPGTRHTGAISRPLAAGPSALANKRFHSESGNRIRPTNSQGTATFLMIVMACSFFFVNVSGQIYPAEIVLAGYVLHKAIGGNNGGADVPSWIILTLLLWALGSLLSDYVAHAESMQLIRGLARTFFLLTDFAALWLVIDRDRKFVTIAWLGFSLSALLSFLLQPSLNAHAAPWKFAFGIPVTILVLLWISSRKFPSRFAIPFILALAAVHFVMGFRSMAVTTLIVALILLVRVSSPPLGKLPGMRLRPALLATGAITVVYCLVTTYDELAAKGLFGYSAQQKAYYLSGEYGSLLSSRSEFFLSTATIARQPIFGGGSFSTASDAVTESTANLFHRLGYEHVAPEILASSAAYHSELLGAWAENGILALPFWIGVLIVFLRGLNAVIYGRCTSPALVAFLSLQGLWDLLFSPFGASQRLFLCLSVVTVTALCIYRKDDSADDAHFHSHDQLQSTRVSP